MRPLRVSSGCSLQEEDTYLFIIAQSCGYGLDFGEPIGWARGDGQQTLQAERTGASGPIALADSCKSLAPTGIKLQPRHALRPKEEGRMVFDAPPAILQVRAAQAQPFILN